MKETDRLQLLNKKKLLQARLAVAEESKQLMNWWLPAIQVLQEEQTSWVLEYLAPASDDKYSFWLQELRRKPWQEFSFNDAVILNREDAYVHDRIFNNYPSVLPLRYFPELSHKADPLDTADQVLNRARSFLHIEEEPVYLFFARYSPVIILPISTIIKHADTDLLLDREDVCITPMNFDWLIFRSMEDEWRFGYGRKDLVSQ